VVSPGFVFDDFSLAEPAEVMTTPADEGPDED